MLFVYLTLIAQYSNILLIMLSLVLLLNLHDECKILTFVNTNGIPHMLTRKVLNKKFIQ